MAQAMASMAGLRGSSQAVLEGSLQLGGSSRLNGASSGRPAATRQVLPAVRASSESDAGAAAAAAAAASQGGRRVMLGLVAAGLAGVSYTKAVLAGPKPIKLGPPPPPSGGLPGTENSDVPRDLLLPLKDRFYIQALSPEEAVKRAKESAKDIVGVKTLIDKKQWPYVQMDLRLKAGLLRYDINTVIANKPREQKAALKELTGALFSKLDNLDHAVKIKNTQEAEKYYAEATSLLNTVLTKLG